MVEKTGSSSGAKPILRTVTAALAVLMLLYAVARGFTISLPDRGAILGQTARNLFFHVPMWFAMLVMAYTSVVYSIKFLRHGRLGDDVAARESANLTVLFGMLGLVTGSIWSRVTWGENIAASDTDAWWAWDPKQTMALVCVLIYLGYFLLRRSFEEETQRAKIAAVFNIFAAASIYPLLYIMPKAMEGLHPGAQDGDFKDITMFQLSGEFRGIFWPAVFGFILLAAWMLDLRVRMARAKIKLEEIEEA
jgi:heme exporter protein C